MTDHFSGAVTAPAERAASTKTACLQILQETRESKPGTETADRVREFALRREAKIRLKKAKGQKESSAVGF